MSEGKKILERMLSSRTKGELLRLFHNNPGLVDTPEGVARRIGLTAAEIEPAVSDLVEMGILKRKSLGRMDVLKYDREKDKEVQASVESYFRSLVK